MQQLIFNIQNIKLLFILATGVFTWTFFKKNYQNQSLSNNQSSTHQFDQWINIANNIKLSSMNSKQIYHCFNNINHQYQNITQNTSSKTKSITSKYPNKNQPHQQNPQSQSIQTQISNFMSTHLLTSLQKLKSVQSLIQQYHIAQSNQSKQIDKIQLLSQNIVDMKDSIVSIQISTKDQNLQFFKPVIENMSMHDQQLLQSNQHQFNQLLTNQQRLKLNNRLQKAKPKKKLIHKCKNISKIKPILPKKTLSSKPTINQLNSLNQTNQIIQNKKSPVMQISINLYSSHLNQETQINNQKLNNNQLSNNILLQLNTQQLQKQSNKIINIIQQPQKNQPSRN